MTIDAITMTAVLVVLGVSTAPVLVTVLAMTMDAITMTAVLVGLGVSTAPVTKGLNSSCSFFIQRKPKITKKMVLPFSLKTFFLQTTCNFA